MKKKTSSKRHRWPEQKLTGFSEECFNALAHIVGDREVALGYLGVFETIHNKYESSGLENIRVPKSSGNIILTSSGSILFHKSLIRPTRKGRETAKMLKCDHRYYVVQGTGCKNGAGFPTWCCPFCTHRVISMQLTNFYKI